MFGFRTSSAKGSACGKKAREGVGAFRPSRFVYGKTGKQQILEESSSYIFFCFFCVWFATAVVAPLRRLRLRARSVQFFLFSCRGGSRKILVGEIFMFFAVSDSSSLRTHAQSPS